MTRILVLSDTHSEPLPKPMLEDIKTADIVVHAGDFTDIGLFYAIKKQKPVHAVFGNMDGLELRQELPRQQIFTCENVRIGLFHGEGHADGMVDRIRERFKSEKVQTIIFGHSHEPMNEVIDGILFFNPGSPTDTIRAPYRSYGVLEVHGEKITGKIVKLK